MASAESPITDPPSAQPSAAGPEDPHHFLSELQAACVGPVMDVLESLPGLVYIFDLEQMRTVFASNSIAHLLGLEAQYFQDLGDRFLTTLAHPDDLAHWVQNVLPRYAGVADNEVIENEFRLRHGSGRWRWFMTRERVWRRAPDGNPQLILSIGQEITNRKESERRLDGLLRHANEGLSLVDGQGNVLYNSPSVGKIMGERIAEATHYRFTERLHPDDKARAEASFVRLLQEPDLHVSELYRVYRGDGELCWLEISSTNLLGDPDVGAIVTHFADVTERMRAENQLRHQAKIFDNVNDAVIVTDINFVVQTWNAAAEAIYGWSAEEAVGHSLSAFLNTRFIDDDFESSLRIIQVAGHWHGEVIQRCKDGTEANILASVSLVRDLLGNPAGWVAINRDISEQKSVIQALARERTLLAERVEERTAALSAANRELTKASQLKDEFLAAVSHEFRTPLQAILGFAENLNQGIIGPVNERQQRYLALIGESGQHLLALINDILEFSKSGTSPARLDLSLVPVTHLCEASLSMVRNAALRKRLHMALSTDVADLVVLVDERIVKQIVVNLLSNAIKFTPEGGAIGLEAYAGDGGRALCLCVWDTGIGIADGDLQRLFQPFVQLDAGLNRQYEGTGLGLALAARLAALHGGRIDAQSTPGKGSRFTLTIPLRDTSVRDTSVRDTSVRDTSVRDTSVGDTSVGDTSVRDTSVGDASVRDASVGDASGTDASMTGAMSLGQ